MQNFITPHIHRRKLLAGNLKWCKRAVKNAVSLGALLQSKLTWKLFTHLNIPNNIQFFPDIIIFCLKKYISIFFFTILGCLRKTPLPQFCLKTQNDKHLAAQHEKTIRIQACQHAPRGPPQCRTTPHLDRSQPGTAWPGDKPGKIFQSDTN